MKALLFMVCASIFLARPLAIQTHGEHKMQSNKAQQIKTNVVKTIPQSGLMKQAQAPHLSSVETSNQSKMANVRSTRTSKNTISITPTRNGKNNQLTGLSSKPNSNILDMNRHLFEEQLDQEIDQEMNDYQPSDVVQDESDDNKTNTVQSDDNQDSNVNDATDASSAIESDATTVESQNQLDQNEDSNTGIVADDSTNNGSSSDNEQKPEGLDSEDHVIDSAPRKKPVNPIVFDKSKFDIIFVDKFDKAEHFSNIYKITKQFQNLENRFVDCIHRVQGADYSEQAIEKCFGKNLRKVTGSIEYAKRKILSVIDSKVTAEVFSHCYHKAGTNTLIAYGCDVLSRDIMDMLWNEYNFFDIVMENKQKYVFEQCAIPSDLFYELMTSLQYISSASIELLNEVYSHKDILIFNIKKEADMKTRVILQHAIEVAKQNKPSFATRKINITEIHVDPYKFDLTKLPRVRVINNTNEFRSPDHDPHAAIFYKQVAETQAKLDLINRLDPKKDFTVQVNFGERELKDVKIDDKILNN